MTAVDTAAPSPFPVVVSFINYFLGKQELRNSVRSSEFNFSSCFHAFLDISSDALRHNFSQRFHIFRAGVLVHRRSAFARNMSGSEGFAFEYSVQNFFHAERETVGLGKTRDFRFAITRSQDRTKLAVAI